MTTAVGTTYHYVRTLRVLAAADPDRVLVRSPRLNLTAGELADQSGRLAGYLEDHGVRPGSPVALMLHNRPEAVVGFYAALAAGAPPANVNTRYRSAEVQHVLRDSAAAALIFEPSVAGEVGKALQSWGSDLLALEIGSARWTEALAYARPSSRPLDDDDRLLVYTGGTTGVPRAVEWQVGEHYRMIWQMVRPDTPPPPPEHTADAGRPAPTALPCSPFVHGVGLSLSLNTLNGGGTLVLSDEASFDATRTLQQVEEHQVAVLGIVGDAFATPLLGALEGDPSWPRRLESLRAISSAGAAWSSATRARMQELLPDVRLISNFGSTEALVTRDMDNSKPFTPERPMVIVDGSGRPVPDGEVGFLATTGHLPVGYLGQPEKSAATFPSIDGVRYAVMGDEARREPDGRIRILGRGSSVINTGGEKVWPEEVEHVLRAQDGVADAVVVGRDDPRWGQRVTAVLVAGSAVADDDLAAACRAELAAYKCPKEWVRVDAVPRTFAGKPDFAAIRALLGDV